MKPLQNHLGQHVTSVGVSAKLAPSLAKPPPSNVFSFLTHWASSLTGNLLLDPPANSEPRAPELRPPPEPPPLFKDDERVGSLLPCSVSLHRFVSAALGFVHFRPPRKLPWMRLAALGCPVSGHCCSGDPLVFRSYPLCFSKFWSQNAHLVFAESPHRTPGCLSTVYVSSFSSFMKWSVWSRILWVLVAAGTDFGLEISFLVFWFNKLAPGAMMIINTFSSPSYRIGLFALGVWLDHRETTYSRTVHILAKEMIRNWIDSKTVIPPSIMASCHGQMMFVWLVGLAIWFDVDHLWPDVSLCIDTKDVFFLLFRSNSCLGYAPSLFDQPDCIVFSQLIE